MTFQGKIIHSVLWVVVWDKGGIVLPTNKDAKMGTPVASFLRSKHPNPISPSLEVLYPYASTPALISFYTIYNII